MLDEKDLQAIAHLISASEARMSAMMDEKLATMKQELQAEIKTSGSHTRALQETYFDKKFGALTAGHDLIIEKMVEQKDLDEVKEHAEMRLDVLEAIVKLHSSEIEKLKKAQ